MHHLPSRANCFFVLPLVARERSKQSVLREGFGQRRLVLGAPRQLLGELYPPRTHEGYAEASQPGVVDPGKTGGGTSLKGGREGGKEDENLNFLWGAEWYWGEGGGLLPTQ